MVKRNSFRCKNSILKHYNGKTDVENKETNEDRMGKNTTKNQNSEFFSLSEIFLLNLLSKHQTSLPWAST